MVAACDLPGYVAQPPVPPSAFGFLQRSHSRYHSPVSGLRTSIHRCAPILHRNLPMLVMILEPPPVSIALQRTARTLRRWMRAVVGDVRQLRAPSVLTPPRPQSWRGLSRAARPIWVMTLQAHRVRNGCTGPYVVSECQTVFTNGVNTRCHRMGSQGTQLGDVT